MTKKSQLTTKTILNNRSIYQLQSLKYNTNNPIYPIPFTPITIPATEKRLQIFNNEIPLSSTWSHTDYNDATNPAQWRAPNTNNHIKLFQAPKRLARSRDTPRPPRSRRVPQTRPTRKRRSGGPGAPAGVRRGGGVPVGGASIIRALRVGGRRPRRSPMTAHR